MSGHVWPLWVTSLNSLHWHDTPLQNERMLCLQAAQDPQFRGHTFDPTFRTAAATLDSMCACKEWAAKNVSTLDDDDCSGGPSALQCAIEQLVVALPTVNALAQEALGHMESLRCAAPAQQVGSRVAGITAARQVVSVACFGRIGCDARLLLRS
jgi:hypothetical protein